MNNKTFTAIDFETAQGKRHSICQVGLVRVEDGIVKNKINILIQPPGNYYWYNFIDIHGITPQMTESSPTFDRVWYKLEPYIREQNVVAHNSSFDFGCLKHTLEYYELPYPKFQGYCTYKIYKKNLASLCHEYKIMLNHHDALSDAMACALLFLNHLQ